MSQTIPPTERLQVSIADAALLLSVSQATIRRLLLRGELRSVGTGRLRRIAVSELRRWQAAQHDGAA